MATTQIVPGSVISIPGTGGKGRESSGHLCVVVADDSSNGDWLVVPICSHHAGADGTTVIEPSEASDLLTRKSYIAYFQAKKIPKGKEWAVAGKLSDDLFGRVCAGLATSKEVEPWFRSDYERITSLPKKGRVFRSDPG